MAGFRLKAISDKGRLTIKKFMVKDRRVNLVRISEDELRVSFHPGPGVKHMIAAAPVFVPMTMKGYGCVQGEDYEFEVIE